MCKTSVETCLLACVGGFTISLTVKVMTGSWMLQPQGGDGGVGWGVGGWLILSAAGLLRLTLEQLQTHCLQEQLARMSGGSRVENGAGGGSREGARERKTDRDSLSHCPPEIGRAHV